MDTSETYIKMSDCPEIQEQKPEYAREDKEFRYIKDGGDYIWLPRQDQLQEMMPERKLAELIEDFYCFASLSQYFLIPGFMSSEKYGIEFEREEYVSQFTSMEQLWLAFVMKEKYNKVWDGEDWKSS